MNPWAKLTPPEVHIRTLSSKPCPVLILASDMVSEQVPMMLPGRLCRAGGELVSALLQLVPGSGTRR